MIWADPNVTASDIKLNERQQNFVDAILNAEKKFES